MNANTQQAIGSAEIICVGTELLLGQIVNTNAAYLARQLSLAGIYSYYQTVVGDNARRLSECIRTSAWRSDLVILTGGLGPTQDDLTMSTAARTAGRALVDHEPSRRALELYFERLGRIDITANNWKQAMMPEGADVLPNRNGTAPGAMFDWEQPDGRICTVVLLPGPPSEMTPMFDEQVMPRLRERVTHHLRHRFVRMIGIGESAAETKLLDLIETQENPTLAPYASEGEVVFRITQAYVDDAEPDRTADLLEKVQERVGNFIYEVGERKMPQVVLDLLESRGQTLALAESCTGGMAATQLTDQPGASRVFKGGVVAYANRIKIEALDVPETVLETSGAVSEACALAMAEGCRRRFAVDWALAVTGIAGPEGGSDDKPIGTVWCAVAGPDGGVARLERLTGNRQRIRRVAVLRALNLLREQLLS